MLQCDIYSIFKVSFTKIPLGVVIDFSATIKVIFLCILVVF